MQYLFLMEREFHELPSHEKLMNALTGQNKGQLERIHTFKTALLFVWDVDIFEHASESQLYQYRFRNNLFFSAASTGWDLFFMSFWLTLINNLLQRVKQE